MEAVISNKPVEKNDKKELALFRAGFVNFFLGEIFLIVSTLSRATIINGIPRVFSFFSFFTFVAYVMFTVASFIVRNLNINFRKSLYAMAIFDVVAFVYNVCISSTNSMYNAIGRGLYWSQSFILCAFYVYFFFGMTFFFRKYNFNKGEKRSTLAVALFVIFFIGETIFEYLSTTKLVLTNKFANRFFLYGSWGFEFLLYTSIFVITIMAMSYINKHIPKEKKGKKKDEEVSK